MTEPTRYAAWLCAISLIAATPLSVEARDLRAWSAHPPEYPLSRGLDEFARLVRERTDGEYTLTSYHSATLGDVSFALEQISFDALDAGVFSIGDLATVEPTLNVLTLPYVFSSREIMLEKMNGVLLDDLTDLLADQNIVPLAWYDSGARSFYSASNPLETPADFDGLKIRTPNAESFVQMVDLLGGNPSPLPFSEVYTALQTGVVDGAENSPPSFVSTRHFEVAKYYTLDEHMMLPEALAVSRSLWDSLSDDDKDVFLESAQESARLERGLWQKAEIEALETLRDNGVTIIELSDKSAFQKKMIPLYEAFVKTDEEEALLDAAH